MQTFTPPFNADFVKNLRSMKINLIIYLQCLKINNKLKHMQTDVILKRQKNDTC